MELTLTRKEFWDTKNLETGETSRKRPTKGFANLRATEEEVVFNGIK